MAITFLENFDTDPVGRAPDTVTGDFEWVDKTGGGISPTGFFTADTFADDLLRGWSTSVAGAETKLFKIGLRVNPTLFQTYTEMGRFNLTLNGDLPGSGGALTYVNLILEFYTAVGDIGTRYNWTLNAEDASANTVESDYGGWLYAEGVHVDSPSATFDVTIDMRGAVPTIAVGSYFTITASAYDATAVAGMSLNEIGVFVSDGVSLDYFRFGEAAAPPPPDPVSSLFWTDHIGTIETIKTEAP